MKKIMMVGLLLTAALAIQAQLKVAPKMQKGTTKTYSTVSTINIPGQGEAKISGDTKYTVTDATADGFVVDLLYSDFKTETAANNIAGKILGLSSELMNNITIRIATDKDGKAERILNYDELKTQIEKIADATISNLIKAVPQMEQMLPKDALKAQVMESVTEEYMLRSFAEATNPLALNGKTLMTGGQEDYVNKDGMSMKRMYFVNGQNVTSNSSLSMSKEQMKQYIISQVEKLMPQQAEMIKQNIDQVIDSGILKIDAKETATYAFAADGWANSITSENVIDNAGQQVVTKTTVTLK